MEASLHWRLRRERRSNYLHSRPPSKPGPRCSKPLKANHCLLFQACSPSPTAWTWAASQCWDLPWLPLKTHLTSLADPSALSEQAWVRLHFRWLAFSVGAAAASYLRLLFVYLESRRRIRSHGVRRLEKASAKISQEVDKINKADSILSV